MNPRLEHFIYVIIWALATVFMYAQIIIAKSRGWL
jgi:hypothetical protein